MLEFVPGNPFQPILIFSVKARAYQSELSFRYFSNWEGSWPYPPNIRLGWKSLPETNILASYENS